MKKSLINPMSGENSRMIKLCMKHIDLSPIDTKDPEQVKERISEYFDFCKENNLFPGIAGLSNWIGVHRDTINSWKRGEYRKDHQKIIQRAYDCIECVLIDLLQEDKIPSAIGIFMLKAMFNYSDKFNLSIEPGQVSRPSIFLECDVEEARKRLSAGIASGGDDDDGQ